jgi:hypothetical protein
VRVPTEKEIEIVAVDWRFDIFRYYVITLRIPDGIYITGCLDTVQIKRLDQSSWSDLVVGKLRTDDSKSCSYLCR